MPRYHKLFTAAITYLFTVFAVTTQSIPQERFQLVRPKRSVSTTVLLREQKTEEVAVRDIEPDFSVMRVSEEADIPSITLRGAEYPIAVGELIQLWVEIDDSDNSLYSVNYSWTVLPNRDITIWPDGSRILFGTGTQYDSYVVILTASFVFAEIDDDGNIMSIRQKAVTTQQRVEITGSTGEYSSPRIALIEEEPLSINLNLEDRPELDALGEMASSAYEWVRGVERTPQYTETDVKRDASKLFASFTSVASDIESETITDLNGVLAATMKRNAGVLSNKSAWRPWFNDMSAAVEDIYNKGGLREMSEIADIWHGIAQGLNEASK